MKPFIVYALPRSRTAWLANFLSYGGVMCGHEQAIFMRSVEDIKSYFSRPMIGAVETAAAQGWKLIHHHVPDLRAVVVRRPVAEVVESVLNTDLKGVARYDVQKLKSVMEYGDRMLGQVARQAGVLQVEFADLVRKDVCAAIFEHCLPFKFDEDWWLSLKDRNIQASVPEVIAYYHRHKADIEGFKSECWKELRRLASAGAIASEKRMGATCRH